jgi:phage-related protein (TIGR01555 family)
MGIQLLDRELARREHRKRYRRADSWHNPWTGLNDLDRDKVTAAYFTTRGRLNDETLDVLYAEDDVAARLCDTMPEMALRKGVEVNIFPEADEEEPDIEETTKALQEQESLVMDKLVELDVVSAFCDGAVWGNVFGAGAILLGGVDGAEGEQLLEPLNEENIQDITHLNVFDKRYLTPIKWYDDPMSEKFGRPMTYLVTPTVSTGIGAVTMSGMNGIFEIHESRLLFFGGVRTSVKRRQENNGWQDGLLQRVNKVLSQFGQSFDSLAHMIQDANQAVFKMDGLIHALAADEQDVVSARMQYIDKSRSVVRAVVLDAEREDFTRQNFTWAGIEKPFELLMQRLSIASKLPVSVIMGRAPQGMNATGEHDLTNLYDAVESYRENGDLKNNLEKLVRLIFKSRQGPTGGVEPEHWEVSFPNLWTSTPKEEAEIYNTQSQGDERYIKNGVVLPEEVAIGRFGPDSDDGKIMVGMGRLTEPAEMIEPDTDTDTDTDTEPAE